VTPLQASFLFLSEFSDSLKVSFEAMATINKYIGLNLFFVTAWNEWNEQALLKPYK
jgi:hypothetical protein